MTLDASSDGINNQEVALLDWLYYPTVIVVVVVTATKIEQPAALAVQAGL